MTEVRLAFRALVHAKSFTALAVATLALGMIVCGGLYAVVDGVLFKPLPFEESGRLFRLMTATPAGAYSSMPGEIPELAMATGEVAGVTTVGTSALVMPLSSDPEVTFTGVPVGHAGLGVLRPRLIAGRLPSPPEPGPRREALIRHETFVARFGSAPDIIGRSFVFERLELVVVGVLAPGVVMPSIGPISRFDFLYELPRAVTPPRGVLAPVGRLAPGGTFESVQQKLAVSAAHLMRPTAEGHRPYIRVSEMQSDVFSLQRDGLVTLFLASALLLLLATVNAAGLALARGLARAHVFAIQQSLGATFARLFRQSLAESAILTGIAAAIAIATCHLVFRVAVSEVPRTLTALVPEQFGLRATLFVIAFGCVATPMLAAVAVWRARRQRHAPSLSKSHGTAGARPVSARLIMGAEAALAVVLVASAALMIGSYLNALSVPLGFDPSGLHRVTVGWQGGQTTPAERFLRATQVLELLRAHPDVAGAGSIDNSPFDASAGYRGISRRRDVEGAVYEVSHDYGSVMGVTMREGRWFSSAEQQSNAPVAVITETASRLLGSEGAALGRYYQPPNDVPRLIVGVVNDLLPERLEAAPADMFVPAVGAHRGMMQFVVRARSDNARVAAIVTAVANRLDPRARADVRAVSEDLDRELALLRFQAILFGTFGWAALLLAAVGVYAIQRYLVERRRREMGVRLALGADPSRLTRMVVTETLRPVMAGLIAGAAASLLLLRALQSFLFGLEATSPSLLGVSMAVLVLVTAAAAVGPARRASRADPLAVIRVE